jgi:tetratricopeptide (TPR) repeat protein
MNVCRHILALTLLVGSVTQLVGPTWAAVEAAVETKEPAHAATPDPQHGGNAHQATPVSAPSNVQEEPSGSLARCTRGVRQKGSVQDRELFDVCGQVMKADPRHPMGWIGRGMVYYKQADYVNAVQHLSTGLAFAPNDKVALLYRGLAKFRLVQENKFAELLPGIEEDLSRFILQDSVNFQAYETRASVRNRLRKFDPAMQDAQKAKGIAANDADRERVDVAQRLIDTIKRTEKHMFQTHQ